MRPGRVDDLALAMTDRLIARLGIGWSYLWAFFRPQLEPLVRRNLSRVQLPGAPPPSVARIRRRKTKIRGGVPC